MEKNFLNKEPKQRNKSTDQKDYMKALNTNKQYLNNISDDFDSSDIYDLKLIFQIHHLCPHHLKKSNYI